MDKIIADSSIPPWVVFHSPPLLRYAAPGLEKLMTPQYKKWVKPGLKTVVKAIAITFAWLVQRIISSVHSSIRGGLLFAR